MEARMTIVQLMPAKKWWAVYVNRDYKVSVEPLACWALIEDPISKKREVEGMVVSGKYIISMRECPNFDGYVYADSSNQALNRAVTDRRVPPNGSLPPERW
jgi:hypothetical protein